MSSSDTAVSVDASAWVDRTLASLSLELEAERLECLESQRGLTPREIERRGMGLHRLRLTSSDSGLYGRSLLTLSLPGGRTMPPTRLSVGASLALRPPGVTHTPPLVCTLTKMFETSIVVSVEELPGEESHRDSCHTDSCHIHSCHTHSCRTDSCHIHSCHTHSCLCFPPICAPRPGFSFSSHSTGPPHTLPPQLV